MDDKCLFFYMYPNFRDLCWWQCDFTGRPANKLAGFPQNFEIHLLDFSSELEICKIIHTLTGSCASSTSQKQECIPVGFVPPGAVSVGGVSTRHPLEQTPSQSRDPLGADAPREQTPPGSRHPPVNRILDTRLWKYYLAPNFVYGR